MTTNRFTICVAALLGLGTLAMSTSHVAAQTTKTAPAPNRALRVCADPNNLPFSNRAGQGFENRIAQIVAHALGRRLAYTWWPQRRGFLRQTLRAGVCDVVMGIPASSDAIQPTHPYYRSTYVFVSRRDRHLGLSAIDDPRLRQMRIGIQITGNDYDNPPPAQALASHHLANNVRGFMVYGDYSAAAPQRDIIDAVADRRVDTAIVWGPIAGYFARKSSVPLDLSPVSPLHDAHPLPFTFAIAMGVRRGDEVMHAALNDAIARRANEIRRVLREYGVPLVPSP